MSNLKDTDIDDLFRRASDKYPLRTDSSDWDRMATALEKDPPPNPPYYLDETDNRRKRRFIWLFLLLPLAGAGYLFLHHPGTGRPAVATTQTGTTQKPTTPTATTDGSTAINPANPATADGSTTPTTPNIATQKITSPSQTPDPTRVGTPSLTPPVTPAAGQAGAGMPQKAPRMANSNDPKGQSHIIRSAVGDIPVRPETTTETTTQPTAKNKNKTKSNPNQFSDDNTTQTNVVANTPTTNATNANSNANAFSLRPTNINGPLAPTTNPYFVSVDVKAPTKDKDSTKKPTPSNKKSKYFYAGILGAPDLSTVHFQKMTGTGTTFTLLLGYAFNSHWSIESGISLDRKRYYSDGEYFTVPKGMLGTNDYLKNVDGTCYMWEIPLNVRYNFNPEGKTKWFATAGLSTYLMTKEKYNFQYGWNGWGGTWDSSYSTKQPSQYPFSVINLSAGFEQRLGKVGNLRIEPYVRIPLSGVGTGKLPILSTGVNIGLTRRLWK